jgi:hypothetical protein
MRDRGLTEGNVPARAASHVRVFRQIKRQASHPYRDLLVLFPPFILIGGPVKDVRGHGRIIQVLVEPVGAPAALLAHGQQGLAVGFAGATVVQRSEGHVWGVSGEGRVHRPL